MKAFSSGWLHTLPQDQVGATNLLLQLLCRLNISIVRSAAFSILHCDFTEVETTRCDARVALLIRHFSIHLHQKKWLLNERIEFWSNRHLTHAEKSDPIAEWIIPKAVELQALPTGQCFIVSCICHSTVHTFVMTVQFSVWRLCIGWHVTHTKMARIKRLRKLDIFVFTS